ncbi:MAG: hypothetical protein ABIJ94_03960 [candidate division WOR-3 bacterium]
MFVNKIPVNINEIKGNYLNIKNEIRYACADLDKIVGELGLDVDKMVWYRNA